MLKAKQIIVITLVLVLIGTLLAQPIKGLVDKKENSTASRADNTSKSQYTLETVSEMSKQGLNTNLAQDIASLESKVNAAEGEQKVALYAELAQKWDDVARPIPQGFIYKEMATITPKYEYWLSAGDAFRAGYTNQQDTALAAELTRLAISSYEQALALNPNSLAAKTGLGAGLVTGSTNPMAGIALLREVVAVEPKNVEANKTLGTFSMQSQQYDKAIERFKTVIEVQPDAETYFYLAAAYTKIGLKNEAISAFRKSKELAADPSLSQYIDRQIEELSK